MRSNFSALLPLAATAGLVLPGGATAAPVSSPEHFRACAADATQTHGLKPAFRTEASAQHAGSSPLVAEGELSIDQLVPLTEVEGPNLIKCVGSTSISMRVQLTAGSYSTTVPNFEVYQSVSNSASEKLAEGPAVRAAGRFSLAKACKVAHVKGIDSVLVRSLEKTSYHESGYPTKRKTSKTFLARLACTKNGADIIPEQAVASPTVS